MRDIEEILNRELHEVADGLHVPPLPVLPREEPRRHWLPALAAAAVVVIVLGVVAVVAGDQDEDSAPQPAPSPTPSETKGTAPPVEVSTDEAMTPYTLDGQVYVAGVPVPGEWWYLQHAGPTWFAMSRDESTWWWGRGPAASPIDGTDIDSAPALSPDGGYLAALVSEDGQGYLRVFVTDPGGIAAGGATVDRGDTGIRIRAVTSDGKVIVQGNSTAILWLASGESSPPVDLTDTAPGLAFWWGTTAGLVVSDGEEGEKYLAEISDDGVVRKIGDLPPLDSIAVTPDGEWMVWTPLGSLGGDVTVIGSLEAGTIDGGQRATFTPPDGWGFKVEDWAWEDDDNLVATVVKSSGAERMVRCSVLTQSCVLIDGP